MSDPAPSEPPVPSGERRPYVLVLTGHDAGALIPLRDPIVIGRSSEVRIRVLDDDVSRRHAVLDVDGNGVAWLEDLGSRNGTFLNGRVVRAERARIADGDRVQIGATTLLKIAWHDRLGASFLYSMQEVALRDTLTGTYGRRYLVERLRGEASYAERTGGTLSLLVIGIDRLSAIAGESGQHAADRVLADVARAVERDIRSEDVLARSGDDELAVIARGVDAAGALTLAYRIRERVRGLVVRHGDDDLRTTVSIGVSAGDQELLERAQRAMARARSAGGDRVEQEH